MIPIFLQHLLAIGSFQGLLMAALLCFGAKNTNASRILGLWCLLLGLGFLGVFIFVDGELSPFSGLIGWSLFLPASYGGLLYLYCKHALCERDFSLSELLHFSPLLLCYLLNIEILLESPEVKLKLVTTTPPQNISFLISRFILYAQAFIYLGASIYLVARFQRRAKDNLSGFNPDIFQWLWQILFGVFVIWSLKVIALSFNSLSFLAIIADIFIIVLILSIAMAQWRNPALFKITQMESTAELRESQANSESNPAELSQQGNPVAQEGMQAKTLAADPVVPVDPGDSGALDKSTRKTILKLLEQRMLQEQVFKNSQLTLTNLSDAIGVSSHHLSEVLNQQAGKNFYQFVNEYRIAYFCQQLKEMPSAKILTLATESGYASKSTFNGAFKQIKGITPSQFRKQLSQSAQE